MTTTHRLQVAGTRSIRILAQGDGPVVVLLHGIPGSSASWGPVASLLCEHHRVLIPDLLGFGASSRSLDPEALHARGQASLLLAALAELGVERAVFIGHDFGGPVALQILAQRPACVTGLGLLATNTFPDAPIPFPLSTTTWPVVGWLARQALFSRASLRMMLRQGVGRPRVEVDAASAIGDRAQARAIAAIFAVSLLRLNELYAPIERALAAVAVPSFVAWGDRDPFFSVAQGRRTAKAIAGARFELLAGAGHFLPAERPAQVAALIAQLVSAPTGGASA
jgi:pimeloyl-ACP methyl ester carboxylesterase